MPARPAVPNSKPNWFPPNSQGIRTGPPAWFSSIVPMRNRIVIGAAVVLAAVAMIAGSAYIYFLSGLRTSQAPFATVHPAVTIEFDLF